jgi:hypothetical protein
MTQDIKQARWTPTFTEAKEIRAYACQLSKTPETRLVLRPQVRVRIDTGVTGVNVMALGSEDRLDARREMTDAHDHITIRQMYRGVEMSPDGWGMIDIAVYSRDRDGDVELETHIQVFLRTEDGRPRMFKLESQGQHKKLF